MTARARIAVLKPDAGITGAFKRVVGRVESILAGAGHEVTRLAVDVVPRVHAVDDLEVPSDVWDAAPEYFPYVAARTRFDRLGQVSDFSGYSWLTRDERRCRGRPLAPCGARGARIVS